MPLYDYIAPGGVRVELRRPVAARDDVPPGWARVTVPGRFSIPRPSPTQADEVLAGYKEVEQKVGTTGIRRESPWSPDQIKKIWAEPYNDDTGFHDGQ